MRTAVASVIGRIGSTITITPYTLTTSLDSAYSGQAETDGIAVSETAVPFEEFKSIIKQKFGDLETGEFQLALKSTAVFDISGATKYKATYQEDTYDIT